MTTFETLRYKLQATALELRTRQVEQERAYKLLAEARLSSLESRIHPHFLFNTLNSIAALIPRNPQLAEDTVGKLASLLRFSLNANQNGLVPLSQELKIVRDYLEIEKTRFGPRLSYEIAVPASMEDVKVPPLALQSLVENSVKHVVSQRSQGATIQIAGSKVSGTHSPRSHRRRPRLLARCHHAGARPRQPYRSPRTPVWRRRPARSNSPKRKDSRSAFHFPHHRNTMDDSSLRAYLVDDEPLAIERLERLLANAGGLRIAGSATDPAQALDFLNGGSGETIDVLFLDIQMPVLNGFELLSRLNRQPFVIFTTAYDEYALKAFEVNSIDYLMKPIEPEQLARALKKLDRLRPSVKPDWQRNPDLPALLKELAASLRGERRRLSAPHRLARG